jgi:hypothetical protein
MMKQMHVQLPQLQQQYPTQLLPHQQQQPHSSLARRSLRLQLQQRSCSCRGRHGCARGCLLRSCCCRCLLRLGRIQGTAFPSPSMMRMGQQQQQQRGGREKGSRRNCKVCVINLAHAVRAVGQALQCAAVTYSTCNDVTSGKAQCSVLLCCCRHRCAASITAAAVALQALVNHLQPRVDLYKHTQHAQHLLTLLLLLLLLLLASCCCRLPCEPLAASH